MPTRDATTTWQTGPIKDARGRSVTQLDPVMIAREVGIGMTRANRIAFWLGLVGLVCFGIAMSIVLVRMVGGSVGFGELARKLAPFGGIWVPLYAFWMGTRGVRFQRTTKVMLQHRRCPHCGYDLRGLCVDEADGATVCPECGCAWTLP
ncbi:MAG: hypothetical protein ACYTBR_07840 [Planctomycetota bacterium]|jgi:hypothetical protein